MRFSPLIRYIIVFLIVSLLIFLFFFIKRNRAYYTSKRLSKVKVVKRSFKRKRLYKKIGGIFVNKYDILRFRRDEPYVFLTFDGCSLNNCVKPILKILRGQKVRATFFLNGTFIEHFPEDTILISKNNFVEVGNHLYRHVHLTDWEKIHRHILKKGVDEEKFRWLLLKNEEIYYKVTGKKMKRIWRSPYGETNFKLDTWAHKLGYFHISWTRDYERGENLDTLDWLSDESDPRYLSNFQILKRILNFDIKESYGLNGGIILFHLGSRRKKPVYEILPQLIDSLRDRGYTFQFVTVGLKDIKCQAQVF